MRGFQRITLGLFLVAVLAGFVFQMGCDDIQNEIVGALGETQYSQAQIDRGRYLAMELSLCWECHTPFGPTGLDTSRLFAGGREFIPGVLSTPNLTPDPETGIGNYTDQQIFKAITQGIGHYDDDSPEGEPLFAIMPYYQFANMTPADVMSIIAFLRKGVEPIVNEVPERAPFIIPPQPSKLLDYSSLPGDDDDPGKYLTSAAGVCIECHTQRLEGGDPGALNPDLYFAGGEEFPVPGLSVRSANITSHSDTGIGNWSREEVVTALRKGQNSEGIPLCPPMPQFRGLTDGDVNDIVNFIRNLPPIDNFVEPCALIEGPPPPPQ